VSAIEHPAYDSRECGTVYLESSIGSYAQNDAFKSEVGPNQEKRWGCKKSGLALAKGTMKEELI
jgi:hypothetical protein